jgi:Tetraspanin family
MSLGVLTIVLKDKGWIKEKATDGLRAFIIHYREDPDQQNFIDWVQEDWLQCCGIDGPKDWDSNNYFNCSSLAVGSREACGVPFSCCKKRPNEVIKNKQCGYDVRKEGYVSIGFICIVIGFKRLLLMHLFVLTNMILHFGYAADRTAHL